MNILHKWKKFTDPIAQHPLSIKKQDVIYIFLKKIGSITELKQRETSHLVKSKDKINIINIYTLSNLAAYHIYTFF